MADLHPETLIAILEATYSQLRERNPDRDEHWSLANTWLARYGSSKQAKKNGAAWTKFIAYKDTHQFSILESPKSIRALALFLVYKELGEDAVIPYATEFAQLTEQVFTRKHDHTFLDEYQKRNPRTWAENLVEDHSPYSLYTLLRGMEFQDEHSEEAKEAWRHSKFFRSFP